MLEGASELALFRREQDARKKLTVVSFTALMDWSANCRAPQSPAGRTAIVENSLSRRTADDGLRGLSRFGIQRGNFACALSPSFIAPVPPPDPQQHQSHYRDESSQAIGDCKVHGTYLVAQN